MPDPDDSVAAREARRRARASWPVRAYRLGEEPPEDVSHLTPDERIALVWPLTVRAWRLSGRELPNLPRSQWPGRMIRPGAGREKDRRDADELERG